MSSFAKKANGCEIFAGSDLAAGTRNNKSRGKENDSWRREALPRFHWRLFT
jgi:hypothetical protein